MTRLQHARIAIVRLMLIATALIASGCGTVRNTVRDGSDEQLMLRGNDPVAYFTEHRVVKGDPSLHVEHDGVTYRFSKDEHRTRFMADPQRYVPQYAGFCASGAPYALKANIHANVFTIHQGKLYLFGSERSKANWLMDVDNNIVLGDRYWEEEAKDVPFRLQNWKRYVFRVPHYKKDAQLDREYFARYGKLPPGAPPLAPQ